MRVLWLHQRTPSRATVIRVVWTAAVAVVFAAVTGYVDTRAHPTNPSGAPWWTHPLPTLLHAVPGVLIALIFVALTRRVLVAFFLAGGCAAAAQGVGALTMEHFGAPVVPDDVRAIAPMVRGAVALVARYLPRNRWEAAGAVLAIAVVVALCVVERPVFARNARGPRLILGFTAAVLLITLAAGAAGWRL